MSLLGFKGFIHIFKGRGDFKSFVQASPGRVTHRIGFAPVRLVLRRPLKLCQSQPDCLVHHFFQGLAGPMSLFLELPHHLIINHQSCSHDSIIASRKVRITASEHPPARSRPNLNFRERQLLPPSHITLTRCSTARYSGSLVRICPLERSAVAIQKASA